MTRRYVFALLALAVCQPMNAQTTEKPKASADDKEADKADPLKVFEARTFGEGDGKLPYRLLKPLNYDAKQQYPLVLFLHGAGERGSDNERQLIHGGKDFADEGFRKRHPSFIVAPQCPEEKKWVDVPWDSEAHKMPAEPSLPMKSVLKLLEALQKEFPIDAKRIYGVGLSMGGYGTWDILQRRPELLAAAVPICGGGDPDYAEGFKSTPVWVFHGGADPVVPVSRSRDMVKALEAAGGRPIYTEYEGVDHNSWTRTFDNRLIWDWMFAQHKQAN